MLDNLFLFKLLISFMVGSLWITGSTILAEKLGPKVGGVIAGMPSSIVICCLIGIFLFRSSNLQNACLYS